MRSLEKVIKLKDDLEAIVVADKRIPMALLSDKVQNGIKTSNYFIPILTENSFQNEWVNQEIGFASAFENIKIIPIVEKQIMNKFKGFIHKNLDLSYSFESNEQSRHSEASKFTSVSRILIDDIMKLIEME